MPKSGDLGAVEAVLETDRVWSAFALADLAPEHRKHCEWYLDGDGTALVLVYRGFRPPLFFALGKEAALKPLIGEIAGEPEFYASVRGGVLDCLGEAGYGIHEEKTLYRMVHSGDTASVTADGRVERLGPSDHEQLVKLYEDGKETGETPPFFQQSMLENGVYYGVREEGKLTAAAGTLVLATEQSAACLGNVYTRRDRRGLGLGRIVTAAVTAELLQRRIRTIALNVRVDNRPAVQIYDRLGFTRYCEYREARLDYREAHPLKDAV